VNVLDVGVILIAVLAGVSGFRRGAALQLMTYAGLLMGLFAGAIAAPHVATLGASTFTQAGLALVTLLALAGVGDALGWFIGSKIWAAARPGVLGTLDSAAGSAVSVISLLLVVWFLGWALSNGPFPGLSSEIRGSAIVRGLDHTFPNPPRALSEVRQLLNRFGLPQVFEGLPPAPAGPVLGPSHGEVVAIARRAEGSTVRIVGEGCGEIHEGSGFVVAPNYVVTNAHVVAGVHLPEVQQQNGPSQPARVVLFNPKLDIAILRVAETPGPVLPMDSRDVGRGTQGAVLGYPEGGPLRFDGGAVRRDIEAVGRDIYGRSVVSRDVYELQAVVRPGNSGGPFVVADGEVAGVVFAASTVDPGIGYALTTPQIIPFVRQAQGRTAAVSTQTCAR